MTVATDTIGGAYLVEGQAQKEARSNEWFDQLSLNLAGFLSKDVAGAGSITLTNTVGGEAHHATLRFTGVLSGNRTVIVPSAQRVYFAGNLTTGAFTLTVSTAGGSGAVIPQNSWLILVCDGTNITAPAFTSGSVTIPPASETVAGVIELATQAEVTTGTDAERAVTPATLQGRLSTLAASETAAGLVELATSTEVQTGTDTTRAITAAGLASRSATETRTGLLEVATTAEVTTGTDDSRALTPLKLAQRLAALPAVPAASETVAGIAELATTAEVTTGTDDTRIVTPLKLQQRIAAIPSPPAASETVAGVVELSTAAEVQALTDLTRALSPGRLASLTPVDTRLGLIELATSAEVTTGTDTTRAVTPAGLAAKVPSGTPLSVARYAASGTALEGTPVSIDASGALGVGAGAPTAALHVLMAAATLRLERTAGAGQATTLSDNANTLDLRKVGTSAQTFIDLNVTNDGTQNAILRLFRNTTTTGIRGLYLYQGDSTGTINHLLAGGGANSTVQQNGGNFGVGTPLSATLGSGASYQMLSVKGSQLLVGQSSVQERAMALVESTWATSTDASRKARLTLSVYDATAAREGLRIEASGTAPMIGFLGATAVVRQTVPAAATDAGTTQTLANSLRTALVNLGLCV